MSLLDTDEDGLPDDWEQRGVTIGGVFFDLPKMGAHWLHKDLFVEVDSMEELSVQPTHSHRPKPEVAAKLIDAFAALPVENPDGARGVTLHLDCGPLCVMDPRSNPQAVWGDLSQSNTLFHVDPLTGSIDELGSRDILGRYQWDSFDAIKRVYFSPTRASIFHYVVFAHSLVRFATALDTSSGLTRGAPASDSIVSLGSFTDTDFVGTVLEQAGTLFHELGHSLGLLDGGPAKSRDRLLYKPNYLSVMNYLFQTRGLYYNGLSGYFSYSSVLLPTLDENSLDESAGLGDLVSGWGTRYFCPDGSIRELPNAIGPIDWNCDNQIGRSAALIRGVPPATTLNSHVDVNSLNFTGASIGQPGAPRPPQTTQAQELTKEENAKIPTVRGVAVLAPSDTTLRFGDSTLLTFTLLNKGTTTDIFTVLPTSTQPWVDTTAVPRQVTLAAGASRVIAIPARSPSSAPADQATAVVLLQATSVANPQIVDSGRARISLGTADVAISIGGSPAVIVIGGRINYQVSISNSGPDIARDVVLTYILPANASLAVISGSTCIGTATIKCAVGPLGPGSVVNVNVAVIPAAAGVFSSTMNVSSAVYDPFTANNATARDTSVIGRPNISVRVASTSRSGNTVTLMVTFTNDGTGDARGVQLNQVVLRALNGSGTVLFKGPTLPYGLGDLSRGSAKSVSLTFEVPSTVTQFSVSERGTMQDSAGNVSAFSASQAVIP